MTDTEHAVASPTEHGGSRATSVNDKLPPSSSPPPELTTHQRGRRERLVIVLLLAITVVLALALGLGLGLGLRHRQQQQLASASSQPPSHVDALSTVDPSQQIPSTTWDVHAAPQTREYNWTVSQTWGAPGGVVKSMLVVNGISPGPLVEANIGDRVVVHVRNTLNVTTAIHWHGQAQNGTNAMDGTYGITECGIAPGQTFTYAWTVQNYGTYWWHAHRGLQYSDGLFGPLILHAPEDVLQRVDASTPTSALNATSQYHGDQVVIAADLYAQPGSTYLAEYQSVDGPPGGQLGDEPVPDCGGTVNGLGVCAGGEDNARTFNLTNNFQAGKRYRFRFINAGSLGTIRFALDNHTMTVVEADGTPIVPQEVQSLTVLVAQRYSVLITLNQPPGAYKLHADLMDDMFAYTPATLVTEQHAVLRYAGVSDSVMPVDSTASSLPANVTEALDDSTLRPLHAQTPPPASKQDTLLISFSLAADSQLHAFLNDSSWSPNAGDATLYDVVASQRAQQPLASQNLILANNDDVIVYDIIFNNEDDGVHPVHLHGYAPWILGSGQGHFQYGSGGSLALDGHFDNPTRRDVFSVPTYGWTAIRVVLDNAGVWALHCHIAWHMEVGFMAQVNVMPSRTALQPIDAVAAAQCGKASLVLQPDVRLLD